MSTPIDSSAYSTTSEQNNDASLFETSARHARGFLEGMSEAGIQAAQGTYSLAESAVQIRYDVSVRGLANDVARYIVDDLATDQTAASGPSALRGMNSAIKGARAAEYIVENPSVIVDAVVDPIRKEWDQGNYGKAVGRGTAEAMLMLAGPKGVNNFAKTGRISNGHSFSNMKMRKHDLVLAAKPGKIVFGDSITPAQRAMIKQADQIIAQDKYASILRNGLDQTGTKLSYDNIPVKNVDGWFSPATNNVVVNMSHVKSVEDIVRTISHESQHARRHHRGINQGTQNAEYKALRVETIVDKSIAGGGKQSLGMRKVGWMITKEAYGDLPQGKNPFGRGK